MDSPVSQSKKNTYCSLGENFLCTICDPENNLGFKCGKDGDIFNCFICTHQENIGKFVFSSTELNYETIEKNLKPLVFILTSPYAALANIGWRILGEFGSNTPPFPIMPCNYGVIAPSLPVARICNTTPGTRTIISELITDIISKVCPN